MAQHIKKRRRSRGWVAEGGHGKISCTLTLEPWLKHQGGAAVGRAGLIQEQEVSGGEVRETEPGRCGQRQKVDVAQE